GGGAVPAAPGRLPLLGFLDFPGGRWGWEEVRGGHPAHAAFWLAQPAPTAGSNARGLGDQGPSPPAACPPPPPVTTIGRPPGRPDRRWHQKAPRQFPIVRGRQFRSRPFVAPLRWPWRHPVTGGLWR